MRIRRFSFAYIPIKCCLLIAGAAAILHGCAALDVPNPEEVLKTPLGTESIKIGMTKQQVESLWGKPDEIRTVEDKARWQGPREVWVYQSRIGVMSVNAGYLSQTKRLYFDEDNLTNIE